MRAASNSICNRDAFSGGSGCAPIITMMYAQTEYRTARSEEILRLPWNINTLVPVRLRASIATKSVLFRRDINNGDGVAAFICHVSISAIGFDGDRNRRNADRYGLANSLSCAVSTVTTVPFLDSLLSIPKERYLPFGVMF